MRTGEKMEKLRIDREGKMRLAVGNDIKVMIED